jgi:hypothetical protein
MPTQVQDYRGILKQGIGDFPQWRVQMATAGVGWCTRVFLTDAVCKGPPLVLAGAHGI